MNNADATVQELRTYLHMGDSPIGKHFGVIVPKSTVNDAADLIENQKKQIDQQTQTIWGIMHSVDKWLDGKELKGDEAHRASVMREKVLKIIESLQADLVRVTAERDAAVADMEKRQLTYADIRGSIEKWFGEQEGEGDR